MAKGYSKGGTIHKRKSDAQKICTAGRSVGIPCRIVKLAKGYRVDKKY